MVCSLILSVPKITFAMSTTKLTGGGSSGTTTLGNRISYGINMSGEGREAATSNSEGKGGTLGRGTCSNLDGANSSSLIDRPRNYISVQVKLELLVIRMIVKVVMVVCKRRTRPPNFLFFCRSF